ncbi:MAG: DUF2283 domain-containing protein [Gemmatimonadaceae bacterium]|nr:DUF2283 domain-containing protein [Gemmatimonadaceae bacterium]
MSVNCCPDPNPPYIDTSEQASVESHEVSTGIVLDYDPPGDLVGVYIDNAGRNVQLK